MYKPRSGFEPGGEVLAQEADEQFDVEDLVAKPDGETQGDKGEAVEGAEADDCETEEAVPRNTFSGPGQPAQSQLEDHGIDH